MILPKRPRRGPIRGVPGLPGTFDANLPPAEPIEPHGPRTAPRSPFTDLFPSFDIVSAWFTSIPSPPVGFGPDPDESVVYCLRTVRAGGEIPNDFAVFSVAMTMLPPDSAGVVPGPATGINWGIGDTVAPTSRDVGILVGINLGVPANTWALKRVPLPGVMPIEDYSAVSLPRNKPPGLIHYEKFPIGTYTEPAIREKVVSRSFAPWVRRVPEGSSLDILLVGKAGAFDFDPLGLKRINGYAMIQVGIGLTENTQRWTS